MIIIFHNLICGMPTLAMMSCSFSVSVQLLFSIIPRRTFVKHQKCQLFYSHKPVAKSICQNFMGGYDYSDIFQYRVPYTLLTPTVDIIGTHE